jgi:hypothetical protein
MVGKWQTAVAANTKTSMICALLCNGEEKDVLHEYAKSKQEDPRKCAFLVTAVTPHTCEQICRGVIKLGTWAATELFENINKAQEKQQYTVFFDAPAIKGVMAVSALPPAIQALQPPGNNKAMNFTFLFAARIAGIPGTVLWDSAASLNFVSNEFVTRHGLKIQPHDFTLKLADGVEKKSPGFVKVRLHIQGYHQEEKLIVTDLAPGFDAFLGEEWNARNSVVADFGYTTDTKSVEPNLWVRRSKTRLFPNVGKRNTPSNDSENSMLSAIQARRILAKSPEPKCTPAFLAVIRAEKYKKDTPATSRRLDSLLKNFEEVFKTPVLGVCNEQMPEAIRLESGVLPPNRPTMRLSPKERKECETMLKEALEKGWIQTSTSAYGAPVLFVPKPDGSMRMCVD